MAKEEKITDTGLLTAVATIYLANCLTVATSGFPFLYCWGGPPAAYIYQNYGMLVVYGLVAFIVYQLLRRQLVKCFGATVILIVVFELPRIFDTVLRMGGSCGT